MPENRRHNFVIGLSYILFISLGLPGGLLGVAWPFISDSFNVPLGALGALLVALTAGGLLSSTASGYLLSHLGAGTLLTLSAASTAASLIGYALAPQWWMMIPLGFLGGLGAGTVDAGLNTYVALHYNTRNLNWLHAAFGVGATLGPLMMTAVISADRRWQDGYIVVGALQILLTLVMIRSRSMWLPTAPQRTTPEEVQPSVSNRETLRLPVVWLSIALFLIFAGVEIGAGQWAFSLLTRARGVADDVAGLWVSIYWGSLTVGRFGFGIIANRVPVKQLLRLAILVIIASMALIWLNVSNTLSFVALALAGFALAPLFPSLIASMPDRIGARHVANSVGFQIAGAGLGAAALPGLIGVLIGWLGLEVIGPTLLVSSVIMLALYEGLLTYDRRKLAVSTAPLPEVR